MIVRALVDDVVAVSESSIEEALNLLLFEEKTVTEGAGAAPLAALLEHRERFAGRTVGLVLSGGNVDPRILSQVVLRGLVRDGLLVTLELVLPDAPGTLAAVASVGVTAGQQRRFRNPNTVLVLAQFHALDDVTVFQPHFPAGPQAEILRRRRFHEIVALDEQFAAERYLARTGSRVSQLPERGSL